MNEARTAIHRPRLRTKSPARLWGPSAALILMQGCASAPARITDVEPSAEWRARSADASADMGASASATQGPQTSADADLDARNDERVQLADEPIYAYAPGARRRPQRAAGQTESDAQFTRWNAGASGVASAAPGERPRPPHPAPRVKVDVINVRGRVEQADVLREARAKGYWPFRSCYEAGLRRSPQLRGTVRVRFTIDSHGRTHHPKKVHAELTDDPVVACVVQASGALAFALPGAIRGTPEVTLEVALYPGDEPVGAGDSAHLPPGTDESAVVRVLRESWPELRRCYADALTHDPELWGRLAIRLTIATRGRVAEASEVESHFPDPAVTACVARTLGLIDGLPAPDGTRLVYPLRFGAPHDDGGA